MPVLSNSERDLFLPTIVILFPLKLMGSRDFMIPPSPGNILCATPLQSRAVTLKDLITPSNQETQLARKSADNPAKMATVKLREPTEVKNIIMYVCINDRMNSDQ